MCIRDSRSALPIDAPLVFRAPFGKCQRGGGLRLRNRVAEAKHCSGPSEEVARETTRCSRGSRRLTCGRKYAASGQKDRKALATDSARGVLFGAGNVCFD
eukprot:1983990-Alexandrium_andersonii.AAC.1